MENKANMENLDQEDSIRDYGPAAPLGPNVDGTHPAVANVHNMNLNEESVFNSVIRPDDMYNSSGVYWADLPLLKRIAFVTHVDGLETKAELRGIWEMIKVDPLSPVSYYIRNMVIPGAGLGLEGYVLFSIGNVKPLLQAAFSKCWKTYTICDEVWIQALDYMEVAGIIVGQIFVGIVGDWIGRRWGLLQDCALMLLGLVMLTAAWGTSQNGWIICYVWSLFIYGVGVGGEYPMTATSGMENAVGSGKVSTKDDRLHRGRKVTSAFLMQGWGQWWNQVILIVSLLIFHHGSGNPPYSEVSAQWTYRVSFAIPAVGTLWLFYFRYFKMKSASKQLALAKKKASVTGYDVKSLKMTFYYFGPRIIASAGAWYCNDIFFYGNKLFQNQFIAVLLPGNKSVMVGWLYNLINVGVSLFGYYMASFFIDNKLYGRRTMMIVGFMLDFILFVVPCFHYKYYTEPAHIHAFQAMYFLSSFFNQFGPNSVTFLVAAEIYPTPIRATAHGFSAAVGKLGALTAAITYNYTTTQQIFYIVPWFGLVGTVLTFLFLPDTTGLDLKEQERRWNFIREGREHDYHGIAIHPQHLSLWERFRGVGKNYNAQLDYQQKVDEMRKDWEQWQAWKHHETDKDGAELDHLDHWDQFESEHGSHLHSYFSRTAQNSTADLLEKHDNGHGNGNSEEFNEKKGL